MNTQTSAEILAELEQMIEDVKIQNLSNYGKAN